MCSPATIWTATISFSSFHHPTQMLRAFSIELGALLLDRIVPGTPLPGGEEENAVAVAADVLTDLHAAESPAAHPFPALEETLSSRIEYTRRDAEPETVGVKLLDRAHAATVRLCLTARGTVLLHGDFLDKNLLRSETGYLAIDPMPSIGDPCSDVGFFAASHPPARKIGSRARALARRLGYDESRSERWAAMWAVGEACETWRSDSEELQEWTASREVERLLAV